MPLLTSRKVWSEKDIAFLRDKYASKGLEWCADRLMRSRGSIRAMASQLKLRADKNNEVHKNAIKKRIATVTGTKRPKQSIAIKKMWEEGKFKKHSLERRAEASRQRKKWLEENEHPRGYLGHRHSKKTRKKLSEAGKKSWQDLTTGHHSESRKQKLSDRNRGRRSLGKNLDYVYSRGKGGKREDLGQYFRSRWEANYARYLNFLKKVKAIHAWKFESQTWYFEEIKRGTRSYTCDFEVWENKGEDPYYVEVKGWMDAKSKTRLKRMAKYYPDIEIRLVGEKEYKEIQKKFAPMLKYWETE